MKKSTLLDKKLKSYLTMAGGVLAAGAAQGQVIHTDISPDILLQNNYYDLDVNNDSIVDFRLFELNYLSSSYQFAAVGVYALNDNEVLGSFSYNTYTSSSDTIYSTYFFPKALQKGQLISGLQDDWYAYSSSSVTMMGVFSSSSGSTYTYGNWSDVKDRFLGLKFKVNTDTYYGWVRLDVSKKVDTVIVKDYAYEKTASKGIVAGNGIPLGIGREMPNNAKIFVHEKQLNLLVDNETRHAVLTIFDRQGKEVFADNSKTIKNKYDLSNLENGVYIVRLQAGSKKMVRKILIR